MEPNYSRMDPEEQLNKLLAIVSVALGIFSLCGGLIPIIGIIGGSLGIVAGYFGRKSESRKIALVGISISALAILISCVYALFLFIGRNA